MRYDILQHRFPDPKCMVNDLHSIGCKAIWMLDPGIKNESGYFVFDSGSESDVWVQKEDKQPFVGIFPRMNELLHYRDEHSTN